MSHACHEALPGYSPRQLLHAGCGECEARTREPGGGMAHLDMVTFVGAWHRAFLWKAGDGDLPDLDPAEMPMLGALWAVQVQLEKFGLPIGSFPAGI